MDSGRPFLNRKKVCNRAFSSEAVSLFSSFIDLASFANLSHVFSELELSCYRHQLFQKPWTFQTKLCQSLFQHVCRVVHVAVLLVILKLVFGLGDRAAMEHYGLCFKMLCNHALAVSTDRRLRTVFHLFMLRPFWNLQIMNHFQLH